MRPSIDLLQADISGVVPQIIFSLKRLTPLSHLRAERVNCSGAFSGSLLLYRHHQETSPYSADLLSFTRLSIFTLQAIQIFE